MATVRRILFISTHGAARAQLAAGLLAHLGSDQFAAYGAASDAAESDPLALRTLGEIGIDASRVALAPATAYMGQWFDHAITLCDGGTDT